MSMYDNKCVNGFLRTDGMVMRNGAGEQVILRGYGAGNWTNPEGFMIGATAGFDIGKDFSLPPRMDRRRSFDSTLRELCGSEYASSFWPRWYRAHLGEKDIRAMAERGYNSVRLVLDASAFLYEEPGCHFNKDSFAMLADVVDYCEKYRIYAILDLHAAPGGQSCLPCDNGIDNIPHMLLEPESRERTIVLWEELARRFGERWIVGGYDLLNEPISMEPWTSRLMGELSDFYEQLIARIRKIDKNHMMLIEPATFSANMRTIDRDFDPECHNWAIAVHKYGFSPEKSELFPWLARALQWNVPIWVGEGGSSPETMSVFYDMAAAEYGVGFNVWSWKSAASPAQGINAGDVGNGNPAVHQLPAGWDAISKYITEGGPRPSYAESQKIFDEYLSLLDYDKCAHTSKKDKYILRRPGIEVPGAGYDSEPGSYSEDSWNFGNVHGFREFDRKKLVLREGTDYPVPSGLPGRGRGFANPLGDLLLELSRGQFASYSIRCVDKPCAVSLRLCSDSSAAIRCECGEMSADISIDGDGLYPAITLAPAPSARVRVTVLEGTVRIAGVVFDE